MSQTVFKGKKINYQLHLHQNLQYPPLLVDHDSQTQLYCTQLIRNKPKRNKSNDKFKQPNISTDAPTIKKRIDRQEQKIHCSKSRSLDAIRFKRKKCSSQKNKSKSRDGKKSGLHQCTSKTSREMRKPLKQLFNNNFTSKKVKNKNKDTKHCGKKCIKTDRNKSDNPFNTNRSGHKSNRVHHQIKSKKTRKIIPIEPGPSRLQMQCASILIQKHIRGFLARRDFKVLLILNNAAKVIQRCWKNKKIRCARIFSNQPAKLQQMSAILHFQKTDQGSNSAFYQLSAQQRCIPLAQREKVKSPSIKIKVNPFQLPTPALTSTISPSSKGLFQTFTQESITSFVSKRMQSIKQRIECQKSLLLKLSQDGSLSPNSCTTKLRQIQSWYARQTASLQASKHQLYRGLFVLQQTLKGIESDNNATDLIIHAKDNKEALQVIYNLSKEQLQLRTPVLSRSPKQQIRIISNDQDMTPNDKSFLHSDYNSRPQSFWRQQHIQLQIDTSISFIKDYLSDLALFIKRIIIISQA